MPEAGSIQRALSGSLRLMMGRADGLKLLDLTADGFWDSFYAIVLSIPPLTATWVLNAAFTPGASLKQRAAIVALSAAISLLAWLAPLLVLGLAARKLTISAEFPALVIASNWSSVLLSWALALPVLVTLAFPGQAEAASGLLICLYLVALVLTWRMTNAVMGKGAGPATAVFCILIVTGEIVGFSLQRLLGLSA